MTSNQYKDIIKTNYETKTEFKIDIQGDVKINILPYPSLILSKVDIKLSADKKINAERIVISPKIFKLFIGKVEPSKIKLHEASIELSGLGDYIGNLEYVPALELINSNIIFNNQELVQKITDINAKISHDGNVKNLKINSNFKISHSAYFLNAGFGEIDNEGNSSEANFSFGNVNFSIDFLGTLKTLFKDPNLKGSVKLKLNNVKDVGESDIINAILTNESLQAEGEFLFNQQLLKISDIKIGAASLKGGKGNLNILFNNPHEFDISLGIDELNLDTILNNIYTDPASSQNYSLEESLKALLEAFDFAIPKSLGGYGELTISNIIFNNDKIKDFKSNINYFDGEIYLDTFAFALPNNSFVKLNGFVEHNDVRPKFDGTTSIQINNLPYFLKWLKIEAASNMTINNMVMESKVSFIPRTFRLNNLSMLLDDKPYSGKFMLKNTGENKLYSKLTFRVEELDLNALDIPKSFDNFISQLYLYDQDKSGQYFVNAIDDYKWLRRFPITLSMDVTANKILYKSLQFDKTNLLFKIAPNRIDFDKIEINSNYLAFTGSGQVRINIMTPEVNLDLDVKKLYYPVLNLIFPSFDLLKQCRQNIYQQVADRKLNINLPELVPSIEFNFFSMHNFNTSFKLNIKELIFDPTQSWSDIKAKGSFQDGVFILENLTGNIFGGQSNIYGNTVFITQFPSFKYSFSLTSANPTQILGFTNNYKGIEGYLSIVGNFTTDGYSTKTFFSRMYGDTSFIGKKIKFNGFNVGEMITLTEIDNLLPSAKIDRLRDAMSTGKSTFDDVQGKGSIKAGILFLSNVAFSNNRVQGSYSAAYSMQDDLINGISRFSFIPQTQRSFQSLMVETTNKGNLAAQDFQMNVSKITDFLNKQTDATQKAANPKSIFKH
jgi:AsmA-like C-terminal region/AsmA family